MSTNVDSIPGKCKVSISVDCPCKLFVQGREYDAVSGDVIFLEQKIPSIPASFFIEVKELSSVLTRVIGLRDEINGRLNAAHDMLYPVGEYCYNSYWSVRAFCLQDFLRMLDEILKDYSL